MSLPPALRALVVGCGSIGSRHARNLRALGGVSIALCDLDPSRTERLAAEVGAAHAGTDLDALVAAHRPHAVLVCTPPSSHLTVVRRAARARAHVFCEKPLAPDLRGVDEALADVAAEGRFLMPAMCYRFHDGLRRVKAQLDGGVVGRILAAHMWAGQYLPDWHPWADYRTEYSAQRRLGGGVLLDSIHSLDALRWLFGEPVAVTAVTARVSDLEIDTEDVAAAIVRLGSGAVVEVHVDYLQRFADSRVTVIGSEGTLVWTRDMVRWRRAGDAAWTEEPITPDPNAMYLAVLREFLDCVRSDSPPALGAAEARATLALAVAARESSDTGRLVTLPVPDTSAGRAAG